MEREFTRKELYDLVWSQPMRTVAASLGISDVALAPRFPGASDRIEIGGSNRSYNWGSDWLERFRATPIPPLPTFDEDMSSVADRARKIAGKVRCPRNFDTHHPLVAKILAHDEERRKDYLKYGSSYHAPRYDSGTERRRLLIVNALFMAGARIGCRPSMSTSKYGQDSNDGRELSIHVGGTWISFSVEPVKPKATEKAQKKDRLRLALGAARERAKATKFWEDDDDGALEDKLTDILVEFLVGAEIRCRESLVRNREWIIERKAEAEAETKRRQEETKRKERELQEKLARERIARLLAQAKALDRATQIRMYVDAVLARAAEAQLPPGDVSRWATWALQEANRIDPVKNGAITTTIDALQKLSPPRL